MKKIILFICLFFGIYCNSQKNNFGFDAAGNQTNRFVALSRTVGVIYKTPESLNKSDFIIDDKFAYYPNPVLQQLYINWKNEPEKIVDNIEIYNMNGQLMANYKNLEILESAIIDFQSYTEGIYNLILNYVNGAKKTLKIVKK